MFELKVYSVIVYEWIAPLGDEVLITHPTPGNPQTSPYDVNVYEARTFQNQELEPHPIALFSYWGLRPDPPHPVAVDFVRAAIVAIYFLNFEVIE